jgi:hypothetical protein
MPPKPPAAADPAPDSDPDMPLPDDAPVWATLIRSGQQDASRDRREQAAATRSLAEAISASTTAGERRHGEMMRALGRVEAAVAKVDDAVDRAADDESALRRSLESGVREVWGAFKVPLAGLVTAACTYYAWRYLNVPPTPTPLRVEVAPSSPAGAPSSGGVIEEGSPTLDAPAAVLDAASATP